MILMIALGVFGGLLLWYLRAIIGLGLIFIVLLGAFLLGLIISGLAGFGIGLTGINGLWYTLGEQFYLLLSVPVGIMTAFSLFKSFKEKEFQKKQYFASLGYLFLATLFVGLHFAWVNENSLAQKCLEGAKRYDGTSFCEQVDQRILAENQRKKEMARNAEMRADYYLSNTIPEKENAVDSEINSREDIQAGSKSSSSLEYTIKGWSANDNVATSSGPSRGLYIVFPMDAVGPSQLAAYHENIKTCPDIGVSVDQIDFGYFNSQEACETGVCCAFVLSTPALRAIKGGQKLNLLFSTIHGTETMSFDLSGSAMALNMAYDFTRKKAAESASRVF